MKWATVQKAQDECFPKMDLSAYQGQWVLLRGDTLIAHGIDPVQLRELDPDAILFPVPRARLYL